MKQPTLFDMDFGVGLPKRTGHAAPPGTGPTGESCKTCRFYCRVKYHDKTWLKCGLQEHRWSHCGATDIRASDPACRCWEAREGTNTQPE